MIERGSSVAGNDFDVNMELWFSLPAAVERIDFATGCTVRFADSGMPAKRARVARKHFRSSDDRFDDFAVNIGEPEVAAGVAVG